MIVPTVETIGDEALTNSIIDRSITELQDTYVTELPVNVLSGCSALKKAVFSSVTRVNNYAFNVCSALETVDFHANVYFSAKQTFAGCSNLTALILRSQTLCRADYALLAKTPIASGTGYIYVPRALVDSYKAATNWSTYAAQIRAIEDWPEVCDPYSWEGVAKNIENGTYKDVYKIGDSVPVDLGSEGVINMQIAAFDADTLADGSGTAAISWVSKELLATSKRMNPEYSAGVEGTGSIGGWEKCEMRSYLNESIKPLLPASVRNQLIAVTKTQAAFNAADTSFTQTTTDEVWLPSREEVYTSGGIYTGLFKDSTSRVKNKVNESGASEWWTRTAYSKGGFYPIATYGTSSVGSVAYNSKAVCLGFCTGKTPA